MKNILSILALTLGFVAINAQVGVEVTEVRPDGIMDFPSPATKGILLPKNTNNTATPAVGGSIIYNVASQQVEYYDNNPASAGWKPMSEVSETAVQGHNIASYPETNAEGSVIEAGSVTGTAPVGVLTLQSDNKALILPTVASTDVLAGPVAGTICYVIDRDAIAVFNGEVWSFWN